MARRPRKSAGGWEGFAIKTDPDAMPAGKPLISVIMPSYNAARYLAEAVDSALRQSYGYVELILVDDGSADDCPHIEARLATQYAGLLPMAQSEPGLGSGVATGIGCSRRLAGFGSS